MPEQNQTRKLVLVTGATGYVGGRLAPRLLELGYRIRCLVRDRSRLEGRAWAEQAEIVEADALVPDSLPSALVGVSHAFFLIQTGIGAESRQQDVLAAANFAAAAKTAGVQQILCLGGLSQEEQEREKALRGAGVPLLAFRSGVIIGAGSLWFEMLRHLLESCPFALCSRWIRLQTQPIAASDVLAYLCAALELTQTCERVVEIGGADGLSCEQMLRIYAELRGLSRSIISLPLPLRLASWWIDLVTPVPAALARASIERLGTVVQDDSARQLFPQLVPLSYRTAVERALEEVEAGCVETAWFDALSSSNAPPPVNWSKQDGMIVDRRERLVDGTASQLFATIRGIGGQRGWFCMNWTWVVRGWMDRFVGGVGLRRGRRDPDHLRVGDALDIWRVEVLEPDRRLRLRAEMKVPGKAWLEFQIEPQEAGRTRLVQTAFFVPKGLAGLLHWYLLYPPHVYIFSGLIREIARRSMQNQASGRGPM